MYSRKYYKKGISIDKQFNSRPYWKIVALQIIVSIFTNTKSIKGPLSSHLWETYLFRIYKYCSPYMVLKKFFV